MNRALMIIVALWVAALLLISFSAEKSSEIGKVSPGSSGTPLMAKPMPKGAIIIESSPGTWTWITPQDSNVFWLGWVAFYDNGHVKGLVDHELGFHPSGVLLWRKTTNNTL